MAKFATIKIPAFGHDFQGDKFQILMPDGHDIAPGLFIQKLEITVLPDDFTMVNMTFCAKVEARVIYPHAFNHGEVQSEIAFAEAVRTSGWR